MAASPPSSIPSAIPRQAAASWRRPCRCCWLACLTSPALWPAPPAGLCIAQTAWTWRRARRRSRGRGATRSWWRCTRCLAVPPGCATVQSCTAVLLCLVFVPVPLGSPSFGPSAARRRARHARHAGLQTKGRHSAALELLHALSQSPEQLPSPPQGAAAGGQRGWWGGAGAVVTCLLLLPSVRSLLTASCAATVCRAAGPAWRVGSCQVCVPHARGGARPGPHLHACQVS